MFEAGDREQDAEEEHDRAHVDPRQRMRERQRTADMLVLVAMNDLADQPHDAEPEQDAHEGRQVRDRLEGGHRDQYAEPEIEHQVPLERLDTPAIRPSFGGGAMVLPLQRKADEGERHEQVDAARAGTPRP